MIKKIYIYIELEWFIILGLPFINKTYKMWFVLSSNGCALLPKENKMQIQGKIDILKLLYLKIKYKIKEHNNIRLR